MDVIRKTKNIGLVLLILTGLVYLLMMPGANLPVKPKITKPEPVKKEKEIQKIAITLQKIEKPKPKAPEVKKPPAPKSMQYLPKPNLMNKGKRMIGEKGQKIGTFPDIVVDYKRHLGVAGYLSAMNRLGGRFYILDQDRGKIVARIDNTLGNIESRGSFWGLSPRSRQVSQEPVLDKYIQQAKERYGPGSYSVILLIPLKIDQYLIGVIDDAVRKSGRTIKDFSSFYGVYSLNKGRMFLWIYEARLKSGAKTPFDLSVEIS